MDTKEFAAKLEAIRQGIVDALKTKIQYPGQESYLRQAKLNIEMALVNLGFPVAEEFDDTCS